MGCSVVNHSPSPALLQRLRDPGTRARMRREVDARVPKEPGGYDLIVISDLPGEQNRALIGKNLLEIAELQQMEPADALLWLVEQEQGSVGYIGHGMSPQNVELVLGHPLVMIGSDGYSMAPEGRAAQTRPHPRSYGCYPRVLGRYVRDRKLLTLEEAIRKMTSLPAARLGWTDRGLIKAGAWADLVVFDPATIADQATFLEPHRHSIGVEHVLVRGRFVLQEGKMTGELPGRPVVRTESKTP